MDFLSSLNSSSLSWFIIPLLIFCARIIDVSIGTIRIILIGKGIRLGAACLGGIEVFIWILAIGQIMMNLTNFLNYIAYAAGFASGTYIGMVIENKLSLGKVIIRIITKYDATELHDHLVEQNYFVTSIDALGIYGDVKILFMVIKRQKLHNVIETIKKYNPNAFYSVEDIRYVSDGAFPKEPNPFFKSLIPLRKIFTTRK